MHEQVTVVLVHGGKNLPSRKFDRVPMQGEIILYHSDKDDFNFFYVAEVNWREDGSAALLLSKNK